MDDLKVLENLLNFSAEVEAETNRELVQQSALAYLGGGLAEIAIG